MDVINWAREPDRAALISAVDTFEFHPVKASLMFEVLAKRGSPTGMFYLGELCRVGRGCPIDLRQAERWFSEASKRDSLLAWYGLGVLYVQSNRRDQAIEPLQIAAAQGYPPALNLLGRLYASDTTVGADIYKARKLLERASDGGHLLGRGALGALLRRYPNQPGDRIRGIWLSISVKFALLFTLITEGYRSERLR